MPGGFTAPTFTYGQVTKTENEYSRTFYSYDEAGQLKWTLQDIFNIGTRKVDYEYDFLGNVIQVAYEKDNQYRSFYHHYEYDNDQRLQAVYTSLDGSTKKLQATYYYYLHGPLKRIELATDLQGIDYVYNIDGSLKSINHSDESLTPERTD